MPTEQREFGKSYLWFLAGGLGLYCIVLTAITGDIGFNGDDWWVFSIPYWNHFPDSLILYARKFLRPMEGFYWISLFELFGFNRVAFHLCSLLLLAGAAVLMGVSLDRAFPGRRTCVSMAVLFAFFLPPVSCLTYVLFTDNSRLSMLLFWASMITFQRWAQKSSPWRGLAPPLFLYMGSFLTYEAPSFLIFLVPMLVWPVHKRCCDRLSDRTFLIKLCVGIMTGFAAGRGVPIICSQRRRRGAKSLLSTSRAAVVVSHAASILSVGPIHVHGCRSMGDSGRRSGSAGDRRSFLFHE